MVSANSQEEPSMEEILASIRRIISDDEDGDKKTQKAEAAPPPPEPDPEPEPVAPEPEPQPEPEPEPEVASSPPPPPPPPTPVREPEPEEDVVELTDMVDETPVAPPKPPPQPEPASEPEPDSFAAAMREAREREIIGEPAARASTEKFADFAKATAPRGTPLGNVQKTLEDLIRELLQPHLKTWLDKNLPGMVERLVKAEIERIAREGEDVADK